MAQVIKNYAFISYSHKDSKIAMWLQSKLEKYSIPSSILPLVSHDKLPPNNNLSLRPIFMDRTDLTAGILAETLQENLMASRYLIVICSPNSAKSDWVSREVQEFIESGRINSIIPFVIGGVPFIDSQIRAGKNPVGEECMPKYLVEYTNEHPEKELLGIDLQANGMEQAAIRVVSQMLGVEFDKLWNRQARKAKKTAISYILAMLVSILVGGYILIPIKLTYSIRQAQIIKGLPIPEDATLIIDGTVYDIGRNVDTLLALNSRPGYYRGRTLSVTFHSTYFDTIRTELKLGYGFRKDEILYIARDNTFAVFSGQVIDQDGKPLEGATITIRQIKSVSNANGEFLINLPVTEQAEEQAVIIEKEGYQDVYRPDECSSNNLKYIMYRVEEE